jgi:hypothetical protein
MRQHASRVRLGLIQNWKVAQKSPTYTKPSRSSSKQSSGGQPLRISIPVAVDDEKARGDQDDGGGKTVMTQKRYWLPFSKRFRFLNDNHNYFQFSYIVEHPTTMVSALQAYAIRICWDPELADGVFEGI